MKSWSKLIIKVLVFVVLLLLADFGVGKMFVLAKDYGLAKNPEDVWLKTSYALEKVNSDIIIIGSSTAVHHYIPSLIEERTKYTAYNCGQDGCFFLYNACSINAILESFNPKIIIWDLNPHSLLDTDSGDEYQNMRFLSYYYNNDKVVQNYINKRESKMQYLYLLNGYKYNSHFVYAFYPVMHCTKTQQGYIPLNNSSNNSLRKKETSWNGTWVNEEMLELIQTISNCKKHGVKLIIVTSPYYAQFDNSIKQACLEFSEALKDMDVEYINLLYAEPFTSNPTLFRDNDHLNTKGAELMTDTVIDVINSFLQSKEGN